MIFVVGEKMEECVVICVCVCDMEQVTTRTRVLDIYE